MKHRNELALHLIAEVGHYVLESDPNRVVISIHLEKDGFHLTILDDIERSDKEIEEISNSLHVARRPELEGYYGSLAGLETLGHARLSLVGWQIKHGEASKREGGSRIDLWLGGEEFDPTPFTIPGEGC